MHLGRRQFLAVLIGSSGMSAQSEDVSHETLLEVLGEFTAALSEGNAEAAIGLTDFATGTMARQLRDLLASNEIGSAIDPVEWSGPLTVQLDWLLEIRSAEAVGTVIRKREKVTCRFVKKGKRWKIASLEPSAFFHN